MERLVVDLSLTEGPNHEQHMQKYPLLNNSILLLPFLMRTPNWKLNLYHS